VLLGKPPRMTREASRVPSAGAPFATEAIHLAEAVRRVLRLPAVADKTFLIAIGDRTVGGLVARDQMVGPWQVPVADAAVTATSFDVTTGEAMAMGGRAPAVPARTRGSTMPCARRAWSWPRRSVSPSRSARIRCRCTRRGRSAAR